jgi:hypothetical protein
MGRVLRMQESGDEDLEGYLIVICPGIFVDQLQEQFCKDALLPRAGHALDGVDDLLGCSLLSVRDRHRGQVCVICALFGRDFEK